MTIGPTDYPAHWPGARPAEAAPPPPAAPEAIVLAIDSYVAALSADEFAAMVARTRG